MERLTKRELIKLKNGEEIVACNYKDEDCNDYCMYGYCRWNDKALKKLKEYEDLEERGLLLRLPCKVGDIVYHENPYATIHTGIQQYQITNIMVSQNKKGMWTRKYRAMWLYEGKTVDRQLNFSFDDIGKTVFLTREAAEAALKEMEK